MRSVWTNEKYKEGSDKFKKKKVKQITSSTHVNLEVKNPNKDT